MKTGTDGEKERWPRVLFRFDDQLPVQVVAYLRTYFESVLIFTGKINQLWPAIVLLSQLSKSYLSFWFILNFLICVALVPLLWRKVVLLLGALVSAAGVFSCSCCLPSPDDGIWELVILSCSWSTHVCWFFETIMLLAHVVYCRLKFVIWIHVQYY